LFFIAEKSIKINSNGNADNDVLRGLLILISKSEFLVDEKLSEILNPYREDEQALVRLDNIFNVSLL